MAEKLSESAWTGFVKKQKLELDDRALVKALSAFDKTDEGKPEPRLKALEEVIKQIPEQVKILVKRKKELGDKPFGEAKDKLYALLEEAEALQKKTQAAAAAADKKEDDDEEPDTPVLLTTKMIPLLRELRKGEAQMSAMICTAGKNTAVLIMRRAISPSRRKLLAEAVDAKGGMKYIVGECKFENKALTFVVQSPASQLAKRIRQALLEQTEMRFKVKVRGDDGVEENDGEDEGEEQPAAQAQKQAAPPGGPASAEQTLYVQRLRKVRERYEQALKEQHPEASKLRAVMGYASEKADAQKDYAAAGKALEQLEKLLDVPVATGQAQREPAGVDAGVAFKARMTALIPKIKEAETAGHQSARRPSARRARPACSRASATSRQLRHCSTRSRICWVRVPRRRPGRRPPPADGPAEKAPSNTASKVSPRIAFTQSRLLWAQTRDSVRKELSRLEAAVLDECKDEPDFADIKANSGVLYSLLDHLDERLIDKLDEALNAATAADRRALNTQALDIVKEYVRVRRQQHPAGGHQRQRLRPIADQADAQRAIERSGAEAGRGRGRLIRYPI
jgi:hypothetical protein